MRAGPERAPQGRFPSGSSCVAESAARPGKISGNPYPPRQRFSVKVCGRFGPRAAIPPCRHGRRLVLSCHTANIQAGARRLCSQGGKGSTPGPDDRNHRSFRAGLP